MNYKDLRHIIQKVNCRFDFYSLAELYGYAANESVTEDFYLKEKWNRFRSNWTAWFCELDDEHARKFIEIIEREDK